MMTEPEGRSGSVALRIKRLYMLAAQSLDDLLKPHGIGRSQWQVLARLAADQDVSQCDLRSAMQVEPATLSAIVDTLVGKGWVARTESETDRRVRLLKLTPAGATVVAGVSDPSAEIESRLLEGFSDTDRETLDTLVDRMTGNLERAREGAAHA